jgi:hypothetical protein
MSKELSPERDAVDQPRRRTSQQRPAEADKTKGMDALQEQVHFSPGGVPPGPSIISCAHRTRARRAAMASGPGIRYAQRIGWHEAVRRAFQPPNGRRPSNGSLALILVLCIGIVLLFNTGQVVNKKVELVNAADAAAYSVAIQQARALNYAAYMNRARVANEVAVAQTISLYSWLNQMHTTSIVIRTTLMLSAIPYIGVVFKALATAFKVAERILKVTRQAFQPVAQAAIIAIDKLNMMFAASVQLVIEGVSRLDSYTIAKDVLQRNSPQAQLGTIGTAVLGTQLATAENRLLQRYSILHRQRWLGHAAPGRRPLPQCGDAVA